MSESYSKEEAYSIKIGLYVALAVALLSVLYLATKKEVAQEERGIYYPIYARFGRTDGLSVGDAVRMAGINIGKVTAARLDNNYNAVLTLEIKDNVKVPDDSSASIVSDGVLGSKYIEIEPGGDEEYLPSGGEFAYTQDAMVLEELLDRIISIGKGKKMNKGETDE